MKPFMRQTGRHHCETPVEFRRHATRQMPSELGPYRSFFYLDELEAIIREWVAVDFTDRRSHNHAVDLC